MTEQHLYEQIEDYLHDRMSEEQRFAFEQRLMVDVSLAGKVNEAKATDEAIHFACLADLKNTVGEDIKKIKYTSPWRKFTNWIIGSAILITTFTTLFIFTKDPKEEIVASTSVNKNVPMEEISPDEKKTFIGKKLSEDIKKNQSAFIPSSNEREEKEIKSNERAEVLEETIPKNIERPTTTNEVPPVPSKTMGSDDRKANESSTSEQKNNCNKEFEIRTEPSCKNKENGSITISAEGGKEFTFQVDHLSDHASQGVFHNLSPGEHKVLVTYNKECTFTKTVRIEEKWCPLNESFSFNPDYNQKWEIRYEDGAEGKFIIYDRSGREVYKNTFGSGNEYWNGTDMNGNVLPMGVYAAILYYSDGRKEKVDLTIVR